LARFLEGLPWVIVIVFHNPEGNLCKSPRLQKFTNKTFVFVRKMKGFSDYPVEKVAFAEVSFRIVITLDSHPG
jgi:hypothetical protein